MYPFDPQLLWLFGTSHILYVASGSERETLDVYRPGGAESNTLYVSSMEEINTCLAPAGGDFYLVCVSRGGLQAACLLFFKCFADRPTPRFHRQEQ